MKGGKTPLGGRGVEVDEKAERKYTEQAKFNQIRDSSLFKSTRLNSRPCL